jgi:hypothetical protein
MRQMPISLKLVAALSLLAEATAAALVFWHTGPGRGRDPGLGAQDAGAWLSASPPPAAATLDA